MSGIRGGMPVLVQLQEQLREIGDGKFRDDLKKVLGAAALKLIDDGFTAAEDPYGNAWVPSRGFGSSTLTNTSRLRGSFSAQPTESGFDVGTSAKYAATHQYGATIKPRTAKYLRFKVLRSSRIAKTRGGYQLFRKGKRAPSRSQVQSDTQWVMVKQVVIPKRQMVPEGDLGPKWSAAFQADAERLLAKLVK